MKRKYLIIGAGHQGLAMSAHLALNGEDVRLWNRTPENIKKIKEEKKIDCEGYINGRAKLEAVSEHIEEVLTDTILVSTPSSAHKDIARMLAKIMLPNSIIYLNPGRTFGAIEFYLELVNNGCVNLPCIVETQSIVYTCRRIDESRAHIYTLKKNVKMAKIGKDTEEILARLPECIRDRFTMVDTVLETSLSNIGMILHCAPVLLNIGWIESGHHNFKYYYDGISKSIANLLEELDQERVSVARKMGVNVETLVQWFASTYGVNGSDILDCVRKNLYYNSIDAPTSIEHRYLDEDVPSGLVPIEYLGKDLSVDVSAITLIIDLANRVQNKDYRAIGRQFSVKSIENILKFQKQ